MPRLAPHEPDQFHGEVFLVPRPIPGEGRGFTGCGKTRLCRHSERSFGVRQLAAALARASLLAGICAPGRNPREQARGEESGSKLPHSKASHAQTGCGEYGANHQGPMTAGLKLRHSGSRLRTPSVVRNAAKPPRSGHAKGWPPLTRFRSKACVNGAMLGARRAA